MIRGRCRTNLDEYKREDWPSRFVSVPLVGASVASESGKVLRVASITHRVRQVRIAHLSGTTDSQPYIEVELHR